MRLRVLHTSDWHLGQTLHDHDRRYEHQCFLEWLLGTAQAEQVDVLLIAGDVFDQANPPASAQVQWFDFLSRLRERCPRLQVVVIAGNHDSAQRLEAPRALLQQVGVDVRGQVGWRDGEPDVADLVLPLHAADGSVAAWCLAVPFLRLGDVPRVGEASYAGGVAAVYDAALEEAMRRRGPRQAIIAMGHCHVMGGRMSVESERPILIGGSEALPLSVFDARIDYTALGHLHLAQAVGGQAQVRYSGSPLPLSFSEIDYLHQVVCVDVVDGVLAELRPLPVPRMVELLRLPPQPAALDEVLAVLAELSLPERPLDERPLLQVRVALSQPEPGLRARIEAVLADKPVRLARIDVSSRRPAAQAPGVSLDELERLAPVTVFRELLARRGVEAEAQPGLLAAFAELIEAAAQT